MKANIARQVGCPLVLLLLTPRAGFPKEMPALLGPQTDAAMVELASPPADGQSAERAAAVSGPPPNLQGGAFQSLVAHMWEDSPTFRRQCLRLRAERALTVVVRADLPRKDVRAITSIQRRRGDVVRAEVVLFSLREANELIAHEIEHVIEQLDGVVLKRDDCGSGVTRDGKPTESCRAVEAGRRVVREVEQARRGRMITLRLKDSSTGLLASPSAAVSAGGRFVVLRSEARLVPADVNDKADLYVMDLESGVLQLESPPTAPEGYGGFMHQDISRDGRTLVFETAGVEPDAQGDIRREIMTLDRSTAKTRVINNEQDGCSTLRNSTPVMSPDGGTVVFESLSVAGREGAGSTTDICLARLPAGTIERVTVGGQNITPAVSADGRYVAFTTVGNRTCGLTKGCPRQPAGPKRRANIYLRDTEAKVTTRISQGINGVEPDGASSWPAISDDGRFVAFTSEASNLVKGDRNGEADIFVHDRLTGTTELVSRRRDGRSGNGASWHAAISGDGSTLAFQSLASDLMCPKRCGEAERDINLLSDVFVFERSTGAMIHASRDEAGVWMEPSRRPALDYSGRVLVFSSRHPIDDEDVDNDDDLYIWLRPAGSGE
jgi:Tol biopolymer transport system component